MRRAAHGDAVVAMHDDLGRAFVRLDHVDVVTRDLSCAQSITSVWVRERPTRNGRASPRAEPYVPPWPCSRKGRVRSGARARRRWASQAWWASRPVAPAVVAGVPTRRRSAARAAEVRPRLDASESGEDDARPGTTSITVSSAGLVPFTPLPAEHLVADSTRRPFVERLSVTDHAPSSSHTSQWRRLTYCRHRRCRSPRRRLPYSGDRNDGVQRDTAVAVGMAVDLHFTMCDRQAACAGPPRAGLVLRLAGTRRAPTSAPRDHLNQCVPGRATELRTCARSSPYAFVRRAIVFDGYGIQAAEVRESIALAFGSRPMTSFSMYVFLICRRPRTRA